MKFIANKGAPDIPLELLEAQESNKLVFFCGAGISYPAGLPSFSELVDDVYDSVAISKSDLEIEAIKGGYYDRALGLLEQRIQGSDQTGINKVRRAIINRLDIAVDADVSTHEAILELSKTKDEKLRVVTTNVDRGFSLTSFSKKLIIDSAPKLPVAKPHKWASLVHLHGLIDTENDKNGEHLVFTSGDFGSAYLTERWASKFVTELFSHFTILFVGYSINDPVLRYMTDAIASDIRVGYNKFNKPFILASSPPNQQNSDFAAWKAKGVEPIFYSHGHNNLHKSLRAWADYSRDGLNGKARIIRLNAVIPPLPPYEQDESVKRVIDVLKEKTKLNDGDVSGYPSQVFSEMSDPPAPIEWLPILFDEGLLSIAKQSSSLSPVSLYPIHHNLIKPNLICENLWNWLVKHLESKVLVNWVLNNGVCLHPFLKEKIVYKLGDLGEPYQTFWRIITSSHIKCLSSSSSDSFNLIHDLKQWNDSLALKNLCKAIMPSIILKRPFYWDNEDTESGNRLYEVELSITLTEYSYDDLKKSDIYPKRLLGLLGCATNALNEAMELLELLGQIDEKDDRSHWDIVSILEHKQNRHLKSWVVLVKMCRDLWEEKFKSSPKGAEAFIGIWKDYKYPIFRRLVLHSYSITAVVTPDEALDYLLDDNGWWLWSTVTQREKFRLLAKVWPSISDKSVNNLIDLILKGPPRHMYRDDLSDSDWIGRYDRDVWHMLKKLNSFGRDIPVEAQSVLDTIQSKYEFWALEGGEKDEFTFWSETRSGNDTDIVSSDLFDLTVEDMVNQLTEKNTEYVDGRIDVFRFGVKDNHEKVIEVLEFISNNKINANRIWHAALVGLADSNEQYWATISNLLIGCEDAFYVEEAWVVAWWVSKASKNLEPFSNDEKAFWDVANRLFDYAEFDDIDDVSDVIGKAINNPIGIITEAFIDRFTKCNLKAGEGIPEPYYKFINRIMNESEGKYILGRVILASRLQYFHAIDPSWTEDTLIPKFDWQKNIEAGSMWQGYLWLPRITADLAREISEFLLDALGQPSLKDKNIERLYQLFIIICLEYPEQYKVGVQRKTMNSLGADGIKVVAEFLWRSSDGDQESKDNYWLNRIKPFIARAWPRMSSLASPETSGYLAMMCIQFNTSFADAVDTVKQYLVPDKDLSFFIHHLKDSPLISTQSEKVFELLSAIFSEEFQWPDEHFRYVLSEVINASPELMAHPKYKEMDEYLLKKGL